MALYKCSEPGCEGHDTFSARCRAVVFREYPPLTPFLDMLGAPAPSEMPAAEALVPARSARKAETHASLVTLPTSQLDNRTDTRATTEAPTVEVAVAGKSSGKDYITFWRE